MRSNKLTSQSRYIEIIIALRKKMKNEAFCFKKNSELVIFCLKAAQKHVHSSWVFWSVDNFFISSFVNFSKTSSFTLLYDSEHESSCKHALDLQPAKPAPFVKAETSFLNFWFEALQTEYQNKEWIFDDCTLLNNARVKTAKLFNTLDLPPTQG